MEIDDKKFFQSFILMIAMTIVIGIIGSKFTPQTSCPRIQEAVRKYQEFKNPEFSLVIRPTYDETVKATHVSAPKKAEIKRKLKYIFNF